MLTVSGHALTWGLLFLLCGSSSFFFPPVSAFERKRVIFCGVLSWTSSGNSRWTSCLWTRSRTWSAKCESHAVVTATLFYSTHDSSGGYFCFCVLVSQFLVCLFEGMCLLGQSVSPSEGKADTSARPYSHLVYGCCGCSISALNRSIVLWAVCQLAVCWHGCRFAVHEINDLPWEHILQSVWQRALRYVRSGKNASYLIFRLAAE